MSQWGINLHAQHLARVVILKWRLALVSFFPRIRTDRDERGNSLEAQEDHLGNLHAHIEPKRAIHAQLVVRKRHLHAHHVLRHNADPVVDIQHTLGHAVRPGSDDKFEVRRAQLRCCHCPRCPKRKHRPAADVQWDCREVDVSERDVLSGALDGRESREIVELVLRQVDRHRRCVFLCYG